MEQEDGTNGLVARVRREIRGAGLHGALSYLNTRTMHRYTGVYLIEPPVLRNICLFDRENPGVNVVSNLVLAETYCGLAGASEIIAIENSLADARTVAHPARVQIQSYIGIPLRDSANRCFGKLCHWDTRPRLMDRVELAALLDVAPVIATELLRERRQRGTLRRVSGETNALAAGQGAEVGVHDEADQLRG